MLYNLVLLLHIAAAIFSVGPSLVLPFLMANAQNINELKFSFKIRKLIINIMNMSGGLLLLTGVTMGLLNTGLFKAGWYHASLTLFIIAVLIGPLVLGKLVRKLIGLIDSQTGTEISSEIKQLVSKVNLFSNVMFAIYLLVLILMVLKPF